MSAALRLTTDAPPEQRASGPDPRKWCPLNEAAELLGRNADALGRECRTKLVRLHLANKATPAGGGAAQWFVARRYDPRLMPGRAGEKHQLPDLDGYSKRQIDDAFARVQCVESFRDARATWPGNQSDWLPRLVKQLKAEHPGLKISEKSLRRWYKAYQQPADLDKLIDSRGGNRRGEADPACWKAFKHLYLDQNRPSVSACWRQVDEYARREGLRWLTESACRSQLDKRIPPEQAARFREPKTYRDKFAPYTEYDPQKYQAGERWYGDHCVLDLMCWSGEGEQRKVIRPWITAWIDWRTRRIVGWHLSDAPNSQTILSAFRMGMLDEANHGGPSIVWIDNGKDFDSYVFHGRTKRDRKREQRERMLRKDRFIKREMGRLAKIEGGVRVNEKRAAGVFGLLDIDPHFANPYNHKGKGRIERWFGTLHALFDKRFKTYCGPTIDQKPEDLEKVLKKQPHNIPTFETVKNELEAFIAQYNATVKNRKGAEGLSPDQAMATLPHTKRPSADPEALRRCLAMWHRPVKVTRNGVTLKVGTVSYTYGSHDPALRPLKGTKQAVHVSYDPNDMRQCEVYDENMRHICTAQLNHRAGYTNTKLAHKDVQKTKAERRRRNKQRTDLNRSAIDDLVSEYYPIGTPAGEAVDLAGLTQRVVEKSKVEPREQSLTPKPSFDFAERIRAQGGLLADAGKGTEKPEAEEELDDVLDVLGYQPPYNEDEEDEDDDILGLSSNGGAA